jgi:hypothetical protein
MKRATVVFLVTGVFVLGWLAPAGAAALSLPETGQTTCYDYYDGGTHVGAPMSCDNTGQDGEWRAGLSWPAPRFTVTYCNASGPCPSQGSDCDGSLLTDVVTDRLTGLMWPRSGIVVGLEKTWQDALTSSNFLELCGHTDWRLPNFNEMQSLLNAEYADSTQWLEAQGFTDMGASYWTSTTSVYPGYTDRAWWVELDDGTTYTWHKDMSDHPALPVRTASAAAPAPVWQTGQKTCYNTDGDVFDCLGTGQDGELQAGTAWPLPRFQDNGDGTVTDNLTGLTWLKDVNCLGTNYPLDVPSGKGEWQEALAAVAKINNGTFSACAAGQSDWRLPNRKEFQSLLDYSQSSPALPAGHPFQNVTAVSPLHFWTSTSSGLVVDAPNFARGWYVSLYDGMIDNSLKNYAVRIWPVRGGLPPERTPPKPGILMLLLEK